MDGSLVPSREHFKSEHLHAAQVAARDHVVPHLLRAAHEAAERGDSDAASTILFVSAVVAGDLDPTIVRWARALIGFVENT